MFLGSATGSTQLCAYIALTVAAGILISMKWVTLIALLNISAVLIIATLEVNNYPFLHYFSEPPIARWFLFTVMLIFTIIPVSVVLTRLSRAIKNIQNENTQRKNAEGLLRESERKFREITNNIPGLVFQYTVPDSGSGYFSYLSERGKELLGLPIAPAHKKTDAVLKIHPEDIKKFTDSLANAVKNKSNWQFEGRILNSNNEIIWVQITASPTATKEGIIFDGILLDTTKYKQLEDQLRQMQKMEAVGLLAGGIAHDFNNLLTPIIGYTDLALMELSPDDKLYPQMEMIRKEAQQAADLTRQILAFSRKQVLQMHLLDLNAVIGDFAKMARRLIGENIELKTKIEDNVYMIKADPSQIEQVLLNLTVNSRDAMPSGGQLFIEASNMYIDEKLVQGNTEKLSPGYYVMIGISDTGHGISDDDLQHVFEPFFTTKKEGKGTGLGLATVFGIINQHGGAITVSSKQGKGTTFKIYLPASGSSLKSPDAEDDEPASLSGTETIIIVEDKESISEMIRNTLTGYGYNVLPVEGIKNILEYINNYKEKIHLLITDVIMPEMNGNDVYKKIASVFADIKVLYISGYTNEIILNQGIPEDEINFLQKPFSVLSLLKKVREVLD